MNLKKILHVLTTMEHPDYGPDVNLLFTGLRVVCGLAAFYISLHHTILFCTIAALLVTAWSLPRIYSLLKKLDFQVRKRR